MNTSTASGATMAGLMATMEELHRKCEPMNRRVLWYPVPPERLMAEMRKAGIPESDGPLGLAAVEIRAALGGTVCGSGEALRRLEARDKPVDLWIAGTGTVVRLNYPIGAPAPMALRDSKDFDFRIPMTKLAMFGV